MASERASKSFLGPIVFEAAVIGLRLALIASVLAVGYLLFGIFSGQLSQFSSLPTHAARQTVLNNVHLAQNLLVYGLGAGALLAAFVYWYEETVGYILALIGAALYIGVPWVIAEGTGGGVSEQGNAAMAAALAAFTKAAYPVFIVGGLLIVRDMFARLVDAIQRRSAEAQGTQYGTGAKKEVKPPRRTSILGKCWEGSYCREFVRVHCPIFQARQACWRVKRGCYCEEDIVATATSRASGLSATQLQMAPDPRYNLLNDPTPAKRRVELTMAQKQERCRNCIIYLDHQRQKYALLLPITILVIVGGAYLMAPALRDLLRLGIGGMESAMARFSYSGTNKPTSFQFSQTVEWVLIGALTVMVLSKALQTLEWAIFKIKI